MSMQSDALEEYHDSLKNAKYAVGDIVVYKAPPPNHQLAGEIKAVGYDEHVREVMYTVNNNVMTETNIIESWIKKHKRREL